MAASTFVQLVLAFVTVVTQRIEFARNKEVYYCIENLLPKSITSGKVDVKDAAISSEICFPTPFLHVKLGGIYFISHVVFYAGEYDSSECHMIHLLLVSKININGSSRQ